MARLPKITKSTSTSTLTIKPVIKKAKVLAAPIVVAPVKKKRKVNRLGKTPKITAITAFGTRDGGSCCYGLGVDNRVYFWKGSAPAQWVLQEFVVPAPTAEEIAAFLKAQQDALSAVNPVSVDAVKGGFAIGTKSDLDVAFN